MLNSPVRTAISQRAPAVIQRIEVVIRRGAEEALLLSRQDVGGLDLPGAEGDVAADVAFLEFLFGERVLASSPKAPA